MTDRTRSTILVGVDGSSDASIAAAWATGIGHRTKASVKAVAAWSLSPSIHADGVDVPAAAMNAQMASVATESLHDDGVDGIEVAAIEGPTAKVLLEAADEVDATMLVVGTRGRGPLSGLLLGSTSRRLLFATHRPLVVVPRQSTLDPPELARVVVGADCSAVGERVLSWAAKFCADLGVPATVARCVSPGCERPPGHVKQIDDRARDDIEEEMKPFRDLGVRYSIVIAHCDPRVALVETAKSDLVGLIVIGTRGEGQFRGLGAPPPTSLATHRSRSLPFHDLRSRLLRGSLKKGRYDNQREPART